jgi:hypothetical protein
LDWELATLECLDDAEKGQLVAHLCANAQNWKEAQRQQLVVQEAKITQSVKDLGEISANRNLGGFRLEYEVPILAREWWRAKFLMEDREAGIKGTTGYECWDDRSFIKDYKKRNPHMVYTEAKKGNSIIKPATRWENVKAAAAA